MREITALILPVFLTIPSYSQSSKPWTFWYWIQSGISKPGITADLEAMKAAGIAGAYLMPIKGAATPPLYTPSSDQLTPEWWEMVKFSLKEAKRLDLKIGMHLSDGFALAGGPWITPELSMQKIVSSSLTIAGGQQFNGQLAQPTTTEHYYRDIAVYAYPSPEGTGINTRTVPPVVSTSNGAEAGFLTLDQTKQSFRSDSTCWIQYAFDKPFTCRTLTVRTNGNNFQAQRLVVQVSDDGQAFRSAGRLVPPRAGWQDTDADFTYSMVPVTARYFRFVYDKTGTEPGSEDLDAAKWKPTLKLVALELSAAATIHQYEGKTGEIWRVSGRTSAAQVPDVLCIPKDKLVNLTAKLTADGRLNWTVPAGSWTILRIGHTSTGHRNDTGGAGKGLECDKFNPAAVTLQFNKWYGEALRQAGPALSKVLSAFHVDSWECGSQNWSDTFPAEFKKRRGYDLLPYLPVMTGIPVASADVSEKVLYDVRLTIAELVSDSFYKTLAQLAKAKGVAFSAECVAPTMTSDGLLHYKRVDLPMGEFWHNSPTHDKPNDMLDAISGAHIYGKNIIQAEGFTTVRMAWNEHPGMLKTLQDRNYALGVNKLVYHVFSHNPWTDRKPGMTLDGVGLYFQRDQTWWKPGKAWVDYAERCQAWLQQGKPVADIAVFTGEELPGRAVLPDRLVPLLPGIVGEARVESEARRLANKGEPMRQVPAGVTNTANMADAENWVNPLNGYAYDSVNPDALMTATVVNREVVLPSGAAYKILVIPGRQKMDPSNRMSLRIAGKLAELARLGAIIVIGEKPAGVTGLNGTDKQLDQVTANLWSDAGPKNVIKAPYKSKTFSDAGVARDVEVLDASGEYVSGIAWNHRISASKEIYFIANQQAEERILRFTFRVTAKTPVVYDPVTDIITALPDWRVENNRTAITLKLAANASLFVIFGPSNGAGSATGGKNWPEFKPVQSLTGTWQVKFDPASGGPKEPVTFNTLSDWTNSADTLIRYYSGTATYSKNFTVNVPESTMFVDLGRIANLAVVRLNGIYCGTLWTPPYRVDISKAVRKGDNQLTIEITNTWANRLIGDHRLPENRRITQTTAPFRLEGKPLQEAGLLGPVMLQTNQ
ncbi:glycosyl hydrolase [Hufsiella ginkgonis]|uniref:glycosyl hydrolase n=1 Tax=Hufsiella ginkgonis TaxID=2695274 RepID=UPI001F46C606|nr:glycosyl hydrolase [Hufsiella ginkgonis]